jgi:hypothetical protein
MKSKWYFYPTIVLLLLLLGGVSSSCKQTSSSGSTAKSAPTPSVRKLVNKEGWQIPGLAQAKEFRPPTLVQAAGKDSVKVYSSWLRPFNEDGSKVTLNNYLSDVQVKELGIIAVQVLTLVKYEINKRPFCYIVKYRSTYTVEALAYYDEDGDGLFELVETAKSSLDFIPRIPDWARQQAQM